MRRLADRVLLEALVVVPLVRLAIAILPFRVVHRFVLTRRRRLIADVPRERITRAVASVARRIPRATCLTQVVAASLLCTRHGHPTELRLGVMKTGASLAAHAWLESEGRAVFGEPEPGTFVALG